MQKNIIFLFLITLITGFVGYSQNFNHLSGKPFIKNYPPEVYKSHGQNFDIIEDNNGIMYFANFAGILIFDGSTWTKTETSSGFRVLSLCKNNEGTVYAGGLSDFGYIKHEDNGKTIFVSLADSLQEDPGIIFKVICADSVNYFITEKGMFVNKKDKLEFVEFNTKAKNAFLFAGKENKKNLYVFFERNLNDESIVQNGLTVFKNNKFERIKDNSSAQIIDVKSVIPYDNGKSLLLGTASQGIFILKNNTINDIEFPVNKLLKNFGHTCGVKVNENTFALGTLTHGIIMINSKGEPVKITDKNSFLRDESVNALLSDKNGSLWVAENDGISKIEAGWNLSYIDNKNSGLKGKVKDIALFDKKLYFATDKGLFFLENSEIKKVKGINLSCKDLEVVNNKLTAAGVEGVFLVKGDVAVNSGYKEFTYCLAKSDKKNEFYAGHSSEVSVFSLMGDKISKINTIKTPEGDVLKIIKSNDGLYLEISPGRVFFSEDGKNKMQEIKLRKKFTALHLNRLDDKVFVSYEDGLAEYKNGKVLPFKLFPQNDESDKLWIYDFYKLNDDTYVYTDGEQKNLTLCVKENGKFKQDRTSFAPVSDFSVNALYYVPETNILWAGGNDGLILYDFNGKNNRKETENTLIRKVLNMNNDTLLPLKSLKPAKLKYSENSLRFYFAAPVFPVKGETLYRYFLKGFDKDTSEWVNITHKDYTNLPSGKYTFTVEAKNEFGEKLKPAEYSFEVLTPVYLKWWFFIIYALILFFIIKLYMNYRMKAVEKERQILENTVKERTEEIEQSKEEIESQRDELYKQKQEIVDSINYAKRIQQAVLPSDELMKNVLENYFVFFRPRDIVSGDFYWVKKIKNFSFAVVADCTGHGVPGAFMSMLGSSFLNEIVSSRTLDSAGEILNRLRSKVKKSLHQKGAEGEQKDGMDISLMIIDREEYELQFAGAYNSLYIARKKETVNNTEEDEYEIIRLKADRQPIGIYIHEKDFTNHTFKLKKGDTLYALSDGYIDQFGGDTGGKFKSGRFKEMLLSFQDKSMEEQKQILVRTFTKWKRDFEQVDDVLVLGIKIT